MIKYKTILFIGNPGTGKSTQIKLLEGDHYFKFSVGTMIRNITEEDILYDQAMNCLTKCILIPFEVVLLRLKQLIEAKINNNSFNIEHNFVVLDSIPINMEQATVLIKDFDICMSFYFHSNEKHLLLKRIKQRLIKENRLDDSVEETTIKRIEYYNQNLPSVIDFLNEQQQDNVFTINPLLKLEDISKNINNIISSYEKR